MSDRNRRLLAWGSILCGLVLLGYVVFGVVLIARSDLEPGPLRLVTMTLNAVSGAFLLYLGRLVLRTPPRR